MRLRDFLIRQPPQKSCVTPVDVKRPAKITAGRFEKDKVALCYKDD